MDNLRDQLLAASDKGEFLRIVYKAFLENHNRHSDDVLTEELVKLHNEGSVDVIAAFRSLQNRADTGVNFFLTRDVLEKVLPRLDASVLEVMECVLHLVKEAGQDMAAGAPINPFIDFCAVNPSRPEEALKLIESSIDKYVDLLTPTLVAGARLDIERYLNEALRLVNSEDIKVRRSAVSSLGIFQSSENPQVSDKAIACLESSVRKETDDILLSHVIRSAFDLYKHDNTQALRITNIINRALAKGEDYALHAASHLFSYSSDDIPEPLLDILLNNFSRIKAVNDPSIRNIDYGLTNLFQKGQHNKAISILEQLLLANPDNISPANLDTTSLEIRNSPENILSRLLTRWFLRGEKVLCEGICSIIELAPDDNLLLSIDSSELDVSVPEQLEFLARKAIGYLGFEQPIHATSIILSLVKYAGNDKIVQKLSNLLFEFVLINYPREVSDYLKQQLKHEDGQVKEAIQLALEALDNYFNDLKYTGDIPELYPSQAQQEAYRRQQYRLMSQSMKEAQKQSIFMPIVRKSIVLYGRKSIDYVYGQSGQARRVEIPLNPYEFKMEIPRLANIDPIGLEYRIRIFRAEQMRNNEADY